MSTTAKWIIGILVGLVVLSVVPFIWQAVFPSASYGMMGYRHAPMMGGYGAPYHVGFPLLMAFMWLLPLGLLVLIVLAIAALIKYLTTSTKK